MYPDGGKGGIEKDRGLLCNIILVAEEYVFFLVQLNEHIFFDSHPVLL